MMKFRNRTRTLNSIIILSIAWVFSIACTPSWQDYMNLGQSLQSEKRSTEAITVYQQALQRNPEHREAPNVYLRIAELHYVALQDPQRALQVYQELIAKHPHHPSVMEALKQKVRIHEEQENWEEAIVAYSDLLRAAPKSSEREHYQYKMALLYRKRGDSRQAQMELEKFLQTHPKGPWSDDAHFELGELHFSQQDFKKALEHYFEVTKHDPESAYRIQAHYNAGLCLEHLGEWDEALKLYRSIRKVYPNTKMIERQIKQLMNRRREAGRG